MNDIDLDFNGLDVSKIDINLKHLYYFVITAETGNITRAAQRLYITQPMLSKNIMSLEEKVGVPLFIRGERNISLTRYGKHFYTKWKNLVNAYRMDIEQAQRLCTACVDTIRVRCFPVLNFQSFLRPYMDRMYSLHPDVGIEMYRMNYIRLMDHLNNHKNDVIFTLYDDIPANRDSYEWKIVRTVNLVAVVSSDNPLSARRCLSFSQLKGETLLLNQPDGSLSRTDIYESLLEKHGIAQTAVRYVNNDLTAYIEAEHNHGIAIGIRSLYPVHNDRVKVIDIVDETLDVAAVWNRDTPDDLKMLIHDFWE